MNKNLVRHAPLLVVACVLFFLFSNFVIDMRVAARPDALEDGVERLAKKAAALPHERRMSLVWTNHAAALSEQRAERLRAAFAAQMETSAQVRFVQGEMAPALRVAIEQTPTQIVFTATIPGEGATNVAIEEMARAAMGIEIVAHSNVHLKKELLWRQEAKILSGAMLAESEQSSEKRLAVLTEEALQVYSGEPGNWKLEFTKALPGPRQAQRSARGQLMIGEDSNGRVGILLPGRRCEASVADDSAVACTNATPEWPPGRLIAPPSCVVQTWWLKSEGVDWSTEDRLLLRNAGAGKEVVAELSVGGPVISISAGDAAGNAAVVIRDLGSGDYEVYRVAVACSD